MDAHICVSPSLDRDLYIYTYFTSMFNPISLLRDLRQTIYELHSREQGLDIRSDFIYIYIDYLDYFLHYIYIGPLRYSYIYFSMSGYRAYM